MCAIKQCFLCTEILVVTLHSLDRGLNRPPPKSQALSPFRPLLLSVEGGKEV